MKLSELIEIEKVLRELIFYQPGPNQISNFYKLQNNGLQPLGWLMYEIEKHSKTIKVEIEHDTL